MKKISANYALEFDSSKVTFAIKISQCIENIILKYISDFVEPVTCTEDEVRRIQWFLPFNKQINISWSAFSNIE